MPVSSTGMTIWFVSPNKIRHGRAPDPAIHPVNPRRGMTFCSADRQSVDARVKHGHDGFLNHRGSETVRRTGIETSPPDLCVSVVNILDAPHGGGA